MILSHSINDKEFIMNLNTIGSMTSTNHKSFTSSSEDESDSENSISKFVLISESIKSRWNKSELNALHEDTSRILGWLLRTLNLMRNKLSKDDESLQNSDYTEISYKNIIRLIQGEPLERICKDEKCIIDTLMHICNFSDHAANLLIKEEGFTKLSPNIAKHLQNVFRFSNLYQKQDGKKVIELLKLLELSATEFQIIDKYKNCDKEMLIEVIPINIVKIFLDHPDFSGIFIKDITICADNPKGLISLDDFKLIKKHGLCTYKCFIDAKNSELEFCDFNHANIWWIVLTNALIDAKKQKVSLFSFRKYINYGNEIRNALIIDDNDRTDSIKLEWSIFKKAIKYNCSFPENYKLTVYSNSINEELFFRSVPFLFFLILEKNSNFIAFPLEILMLIFAKVSKLTIQSMLEEIYNANFFVIGDSYDEDGQLSLDKLHTKAEAFKLYDNMIEKLFFTLQK